MVERLLFEPGHLNFLKLRPEYQDTVFNLERAKRVLYHIPGGAEGDALTLIVDDKILACFGYFLIFPGVVQVWLLPSIYLDEHPIIFVRIVKRYIEQTADVFNWHRVQTVTEVNDKHRRWMKTLGFVEEGVMKKYFNNQDYVMSARYFERG